MTGYRLTESAEADLVEILNYIAAQSGGDRAMRVYEEFLKSFEGLAVDPRVGRRRPELTDGPLRWWPVFRFLVVYDADAEPVDILRIIHGARDIAAALSGDTDSSV